LNKLNELYARVVETGRVPSDAEMGATLRRGSRSERDAAVDGLRREAKRILAIRTGDTDAVDEAAAIAEIVETTAQKYAAFIETDRDAVAMAEARGLAESIANHPRGGIVDQQKKAKQVRDQRAAREPLRELFAAASLGRGIRQADVAELDLGDDVTAEQRAAFSRDVLAAADRIRRFRDVGNYAQARRVGEDATERLGGILAEPRHEDPNAHLSDPRDLASAIMGDRRDRGQAV
jgi:hypothetical protein